MNLYFGQNFLTKNLILFHQSQNLSPAMTRSENTISEFACEISYTDDDLKNFQEQNWV